ncbi:MAG TPA: glycosyltransferase family 4 protein [Phototrophicaceae bacterium]|nr:glycosyltransferase family 4 protein [Phototrophicaceae bacterium]
MTQLRPRLRLLYLSNARLPSVMAHGLQIVQNCEAFAENGADVTLWHPRHIVPEAERHLNPDLWEYYGVERNFHVRRLLCLDLVWLIKRDTVLRRVLFYLQFGTYSLIVMIAVLFTHRDIYYSRDPLTLLLVGLVKPHQKLIYEAHRLNQPGMGIWLQRQVLRRCALTVAITPPLRDKLEQLQANSPVKSQVIVAHDGIRRARFERLPVLADARHTIGWLSEAFIVGYVGRLKTLGMDKGLDTLIQALALIPEHKIALAIVGGPEDMVAGYRDLWLTLGLPETQFLYAGQVDSGRVPLYLSAMDVCAMPHPWTEQFAYYTSPIKLFEYMASGRALVASDLPAYADVVMDDETALLVPPGNAQALADALWRLCQDAGLRSRLAQAARERVMMDYTWEARTHSILQCFQDQWLNEAV